MKKVLNVAIAGKGFVIDEDAYAKLKNYLEKFKSSANMGYQAKELMDDIEERIAELFSQHITDYKNVVSIELVNQVISQLGMPDGSAFVEDDKKTAETAAPEIRPARKFYRNPDGKTIGGVCTGLSTYFNIDVTVNTAQHGLQQGATAQRLGLADGRDRDINLLAWLGKWWQFCVHDHWGDVRDL